MAKIRQKKSCSNEQLFFAYEANGLFLVATVTLGRALILGFVAALTESVAIFHVPLLVRREVGVLVANVTFILGLMLGMGEYGGFLGCIGLQGDVGRALVCGKSGACNGKAKNKCEGCGTDNGFLHCSSPLIQLVYKIGFMNPHSLTNVVL
jgi:hypothetical protein